MSSRAAFDSNYFYRNAGPWIVTPASHCGKLPTRTDGSAQLEPSHGSAVVYTWRIPKGENCLEAKKKAVLNDQNGLFNFNPGGDLRSHTVARAVSSARRGLTSVFGMGTGVTLAV